MKVFYIIIVYIFIFPTLPVIYSQVPIDFYKSGFPKSTGTHESGVKGISDIEFYYPTNYYDTPFDIRAVFPFEKVQKSTITKITVNGTDIERFVIFNNQVYSKFNKVNGEDDLVVACMANWEYDQSYTVTVEGIKDNMDSFKLSVSAKSPIKNIFFNQKDQLFNRKSITIPLSSISIQTSEIKNVFIKHNGKYLMQMS